MSNIHIVMWPVLLIQNRRTIMLGSKRESEKKRRRRRSKRRSRKEKKGLVVNGDGASAQKERNCQWKILNREFMLVSSYTRLRSAAVSASDCFLPSSWGALRRNIEPGAGRDQCACIPTLPTCLTYLPRYNTYISRYVHDGSHADTQT